MFRMQDDNFCFVAILIVWGNLQGISYKERFQLRLFSFYGSIFKLKRKNEQKIMHQVYILQEYKFLGI